MQLWAREFDVKEEEKEFIDPLDFSCIYMCVGGRLGGELGGQVVNSAELVHSPPNE